MRRAAKRFINYIRSERGLSASTVQSYRDDLKKFIEHLESRWGRGLLLGDVTPEMIHEFLDFLAHTGYRKKNGPAARPLRPYIGHHARGRAQDPASGRKPVVRRARSIRSGRLRRRRLCRLLCGSSARCSRRRL